MNYELKTCIKQNTKKKERKRRENTLFTKGKDNCLFYNYFTKFEEPWKFFHVYFGNSQWLSWQQQSIISQKQKEIDFSAILKCDLPQVNKSVDFSMVIKNFLALDQFIPLDTLVLNVVL